MQVSVRELKNKLSYYLNLVQHGEQVLVTSHRKTVATLKGADDTNTDIRWSQQKPSFASKLTPTDASAKTLADIVLESRG